MQHLHKPRLVTRLHPSSCWHFSKAEECPLVTVSPRKLFPLAWISLSIPARRMEETYIYQVFISKATVGFFLLVPIHLTPPGVGVFREPQGLQQEKTGKKDVNSLLATLSAGSLNCGRSELGKQHSSLFLDTLSVLPSIPTDRKSVV